MGSPVTGPNFTAVLPETLVMGYQHPAWGFVFIAPEALSATPQAQALHAQGSNPFVAWTRVSPATILVQSVDPVSAKKLMKNLKRLHRPWTQILQSQSLGIAIYEIHPARAIPFQTSTCTLREADGLVAGIGPPVRVTAMLLQGATGTVKIVSSLNLYRWTEFAQYCIQFAASVNLSGLQLAPYVPPVQTVIDRANTQQLELRVAGRDGLQQPVSSFPTSFNGNIIVNIGTYIHKDESIRAEGIVGTGITFGNHSTSTVSTEARTI
jgi:hypothetical protein